MWNEKLDYALVLQNDNLCYHHLLSNIKVILGFLDAFFLCDLLALLCLSLALTSSHGC